MQEALSEIGRAGGLLPFAHPARSFEWNFLGYFNDKVIHTDNIFDYKINGSVDLVYVFFIPYISDFVRKTEKKIWLKVSFPDNKAKGERDLMVHSSP